MRQGIGWINPEISKRSVSILAGVVGGTGMLAIILPHTFYLDKYRKITQAYKHGIPVKLKNEVREQANSVLQQVPILKRDIIRIDFFCGYGFDPFCIGSAKLTNGAFIGLPVNFAYTSTADVDTFNIKVLNKTVAWETASGAALRSSLILSTAAQHYAIATQIYHATTHHVWQRISLTTTITLLAYTVLYRLNNRLALHARKRSVRFTFYSLVIGMAALMWLFLSDALRVHHERGADDFACSMGEDYIRGGIEYYEKLLQRNLALRELMGKEGEHKFSGKGNPRELFRFKHVPPTSRYEYVLHRLKEFHANHQKND
ncbi:unnamed protein product [Darwinula stevensoni]|uniref:Transmembrane protein 177 n=1 Tax=Darwinula stevensoni TaxID=69355 RepID=A0A7R8XF92_9CRUS|nr:unnamed protein product [Darwinula stevensoni]CAG0896034.1 unnamed protein product [Darwinula stevensoni]